MATDTWPVPSIQVFRVVLTCAAASVNGTFRFAAIHSFTSLKAQTPTRMSS